MHELKSNSWKFILHHNTHVHDFTNRIKNLKEEDFTFFILFPLLFICFFTAIYLFSNYPLALDPENFKFIYFP